MAKPGEGAQTRKDEPCRQNQFQGLVQTEACPMDRGYQPIQTWAIMMESGRAKPGIDVREPAGPKYALVEGPVDSSAAVDVYKRISVAAR